MFVRTVSKRLSRVAVIAIGLGIACTLFASSAQAQSQPH